MMRQRVLSLFLAALLVLASCAPAPAPDGYDWCYTYDFAESVTGINIITGSHIAVQGISTDGTGLLQANWSHELTVQPTLIIVRATRAAGTTGDVTVAANAIVFGVPISFSETLPGAISNIELPIQPTTAGQNGTTVNITVDASAPMILQSIEVRGIGANPFPTNECGNETPTASPTGTAAFTATPSPTMTVTPGPSPTPTTFPTPCLLMSDPIDASKTYTYSGSGNNYEHTISWTRPPHLAGASLFYAGYVQTLSFSGVSATVTSFTGQDGDLAIETRNKVAIISSAYSTSVLTQANTIAALYPTYTRIDLGAAGFGIGATHESYFRIWGGFFPWAATTSHTVRYIFVSDNPIACQVFPTPTPTSTAPPTATLIPTRTPMGIFNTTPRPTRTPIVPATSTPAATSTAIATSTALPSPLPTRTLIPGPTMPATGTPDPSNPNPIGENEAEWEILGALGDFFTWVQNGINNFFDWLGQIGNWLAGTAYNIGVMIGNVISLIGGVIGNAIRFFLELWDIGRLLVQLLFSTIGLAFAWIAGAMTRVGMIFNAFTTAPPVPIPGMPTCFTNPTAHDVCAVYYILDYTILSQGTPGAFIIPLLVIVMNLAIILLFIRFMLKFLRRGESATHV